MGTRGWTTRTIPLSIPQNPLPPLSNRTSDIASVPCRECRLFRHLFQDREVAGIPGLHDDVKLVPDLPKHGVVVVLEVLETEVLLGHDRGNQLVVLEDIDRRALTRIGSVQGSHDGVL